MINSINAPAVVQSRDCDIRAPQAVPDSHHFSGDALVRIVKQSIGASAPFCKSVLDTTESRIKVLIVWLKPVTIGPPRNAGRCSRRCAFEHVMLAVEEIRRISVIERKRTESGKGPEHR